MTTASSGSGWTRPYSFLSRIGRPWPSSELAGLVKAAGWPGPLMIRSALALLLSAMQMTLPGRGTGGSHSSSLTRTVAACRADRATAGPAAAQSPIRPLIVRPGSSSDGPLILDRNRDPLRAVDAHRSQLHQLASEPILERADLLGKSRRGRTRRAPEPNRPCLCRRPAGSHLAGLREWVFPPARTTGT